MQSTMFSNTSNVLISSGNFIQNINSSGKPRTSFSCISYQCYFQDSAILVSDHLLEHCALGALLDAKERFDPPRCAPETREAIIKDIIAWVEENEQSASSILWLYGPAGAGKSAIAQTIAQNCKENGLLIASHFFSRTSSSSERSDGDRVIPNLSLQLLQAFPVIERYIEGVIRKDPGIFNKLRSIQMEELVIKPLHYLFQFPRDNGEPQVHNGRLIVVDGLDECSGPEVQCDLLHIIASACHHIPLPLRFLIASRPEIHIRGAFGNDSGVKRINLGDDPHANMAIRRYLLREFEKIRSNHRFGANFYPTDSRHDQQAYRKIFRTVHLPLYRHKIRPAPSRHA